MKYINITKFIRFNISLKKLSHKNLIISIIQINKINSILNWNYGLYGACKGNHTIIINYMIKNGANDWNLALCGACKGGHMDLVKRFINKNIYYDWRIILNFATCSGNKEICKLIILKCQYKSDLNFRECLIIAMEKYYPELIKFYKAKLNIHTIYY